MTVEWILRACSNSDGRGRSSLFFPFFFLHSLTGGISETLEIEIKMGIESEGWDLKFVEIESGRIEIWEDLKEGVVV